MGSCRTFVLQNGIGLHLLRSNRYIRSIPVYSGLQAYELQQPLGQSPSTHQTYRKQTYCKLGSCIGNACAYLEGIPGAKYGHMVGR